MTKTYRMQPDHPMVKVCLQEARKFVVAALEDPTQENFCNAFANAVNWLYLSDNEVAKVLQISRPTVQRWRDGVSCVHPVGRHPVLNWLLKLIDEKLNEK